MRLLPIFVPLALYMHASSCASSPVEPTTAVTVEEFLSASIGDGFLKNRSGEVSGASLQWTNDSSGLIVAMPAMETGTSSIFYFDLVSGKQSSLAQGTRPKLSPDGRHVGFTRSDGALVISRLRGGQLEERAIVSTRPDGGEASLMKSPVEFAFSRSSDRVAYIKYQELQTAALLEGHPTYGKEAVNPEIRTLDLATGIEARLFAAPPAELPTEYGELVNPQIANLVYGADDRLFFTQGFGLHRVGFETHLYSVLAGEAPVKVAEDIENHNLWLDMRMSPDGTHLVSAASANPDFLSYAAMTGRAIFNTTTGARTNLYSGPYSGGHGATWVPDSRSVYFWCKPGAFAGTLCNGDARSGKITEVADLETRAEILHLVTSPDGKQVAWLSWDREDSFRLKLRDVEGGFERVLWETPSPIELEHKQLGRTRLVRWTSFDGLEIEGVLILPIGYREGDKVPLIVDIHGGARGGVRIEGSLFNSSPLEHQIWTGMGFAVFLADYRKGLVAWNNIDAVRRIENMSFHEGDAADVIAGIEHIIDIGVAHPKRIVAIGHSYGATILNQLITQSDVLALAVSKEGSYDFRDALRVNAENQPASFKTLLYMWRATPANLAEHIEKSSPIVYADQINTPLLLITSGANNPEIASLMKERSDAFAGAINDAGGMAFSLFFADDYHVISREKNIRQMMDVTLEWIERYIGVPQH